MIAISFGGRRMKVTVHCPPGYTLDRNPNRGCAIVFIPQYRTPGEKAWNHWRFEERWRAELGRILAIGYEPEQKATDADASL